MINRLETPQELSEIFKDLPENWVQFLTENCTNERFWIIAEMDNGIIGYVVALNSIVPPMSNYFTVLLDGGETGKVVSTLKAEAKKCGASLIVRAVKEMTSELTEAGWKQESINIKMEI